MKKIPGVRILLRLARKDALTCWHLSSQGPPGPAGIPGPSGRRGPRVSRRAVSRLLSDLLASQYVFPGIVQQDPRLHPQT